MASKANGEASSWNYEEWLEDGFTVHAPVGHFRANAFGLHDVIGNVWEWSRDGYGGYRLPLNPGDGERLLQSPARSRVYRGGSFDNAASYARSAIRTSFTPVPRDDSLGVRPSMVIAE